MSAETLDSISVAGDQSLTVAPTGNPAALHWGFLAPEVKAAFDAAGLDFGGHVTAQDGSQHLRPDQLIPVLWKAVQELMARVEALEGKPLTSSPN